MQMNSKLWVFLGTMAGLLVGIAGGYFLDQRMNLGGRAMESVSDDGEASDDEASDEIKFDGTQRESALEKYTESLEIRAEVLDEPPESTPQQANDYLWSLAKCRDVAIETGNFGVGLEHGNDRFYYEMGGDLSLIPSVIPSEAESLLRHLVPVMKCEFELALVEPAKNSIDVAEDLLAKLAGAFQDNSVNKIEQRLDSATLFLCAHACEQLAKLHELCANAKEAAHSKSRAVDLHNQAEKLKALEAASNT